MRMKATLLAVLAACTIGLLQARAETPAEMAKKAYDEVAAWAAEANSLVVQSTALEAKLTKALATLDKPAEKEALQKKINELKAIIEGLRAAEVKAAAAAAAAQDALKRATAEGVSLADAEAAAGQAQRQARIGLTPRSGLLKSLSRWVRSMKGTPYEPFLDDSPIGNMTNAVPPALIINTRINTLSTDIPGLRNLQTLAPQPGPTPTPVGKGRRPTDPS